MSNVSYSPNGALNTWVTMMLTILDDRRREKGIKLKDIADEMDVVPSTATRLANGTMEMSIPYFLLYCASVRENPIEIIEEAWKKNFSGKVKIDGKEVGFSDFFNSIVKQEGNPMSFLERSIGAK